MSLRRSFIAGLLGGIVAVALAGVVLSVAQRVRAAPDPRGRLRADLGAQLDAYDRWYGGIPEFCKPRAESCVGLAYSYQDFIADHPLYAQYEQFFLLLWRKEHNGRDWPYSTADLRAPARIDRFVQTRWFP
jgi:hypothetical protein